ncbi:MAG: SGNH/GDSL hydrolase family protein [Bacteriovoracia bacterium]
MKRVLCFGDSNTWGYIPGTGLRYDPDTRWTGVLQKLLGPQYLIIEEGLNGRTTISDYREREGRHGARYLVPCLDSHYPLDVVILCLGTNDAKAEFGLSAERIAQGMEELIQTVRGHRPGWGRGVEIPSQNARLIVMAPVVVREAHIGDYAELVGAEAKTLRLGELYRALATKYDAAFLDLAQVTEPSDIDGCHLDELGHAAVAEELVAVVKGSPLRTGN